MDATDPPLSVLRVANVIRASEANGPGVRTVVHFGGCTLGCTGCFNQHLWPVKSANYREVTPQEFARELSELGPHFTFSGGEPLEQPMLATLTRELHARLKQREPTFILYTGYTMAEMSADQLFAVSLMDAVIMGRYNAVKPAAGFCSSSNQSLLLLSDRYKVDDFARKVEVVIDTAGTRTITGIPTEELRRGLA